MMRRSFFLLTFLLLFCFCVPAKAVTEQEQATEQEQTLDQAFNVHSAILFDLTQGTVLFEQNADERIQPASLTKIMSMFLALDAVSQKKARFDTLVPISKRAASESGSRMGIQPGEKVRLGDLLLGMAVSSGNDASYAVGEFIGGSNDSFVALMNAKARSLGMNSTHFCTPNGLPMPGQYTTARDMLTLARAYLARYPWALAFHNRRVLKHLNYVSWNKNPLLAQYPGADGLKTGWVRASGYNIIFTAQRKNHRLLAVILGAPDAMHRGIEACRMLDAGFLVCSRKEDSIEAALSHLPFDNYKLDLYRNAHEAVELYGYVSSGAKSKRKVGRKGAVVERRQRGKTRQSAAKQGKRSPKKQGSRKQKKKQRS